MGVTGCGNHRAAVLRIGSVGNVVDIFSLPDMKLKGKLTGFVEPLGECSDARGDVWIADALQSELLEYSHAGVLAKKIAPVHAFPWACAVDPRDGSIAVVAARSARTTPRRGCSI